MNEPMSDERLNELRIACAHGIENFSPYVYMSAYDVDQMAAELLRLRSALAARPEPIGYAVASTGPYDGVSGLFGTADAARDAEAWSGPGWQVCALVPVEDGTR